MDDKKQQSIRAARDWLDEADASLSEGSGIRGDLKVMLAQAELRHAQENEPKTRWQVWQKRLTRLLPLTAAAVLAALAFWLTPAVAPPEETAGLSMPPAEIQEQASGTEEEERLVPQAEAAAPMREEAAPAGASASDTAAASSEAAREVPATEAEPPLASSSSSTAPAAAASPQSAAQAAPAPAVPAPEMQKLMQTAGKALREP